MVEEFLTGRGTLQQIGFSTPNQSLLGAILLVFGGATLVGTVSTLTKATGGKLSLKCADAPRHDALDASLFCLEQVHVSHRCGCYGPHSVPCVSSFVGRTAIRYLDGADMN